MNPLKTKPGELAPDDKRITRKEARDLLTALDKPEFGGLMDDYIKEISNPNNIKETNQFLKESEEKKDLPANVKLAKPKEGFCIRSEKYNIKRPSQRKKVFINIVSLEDVQEPQSDNNNMWKLPYLLNPGRHDQDKKGKYCTTYDVVFNPKAIELANGNLAFKKFVCDTAIEGINNQILSKEEEKISKDFVMKKFNYKGLEVSYVNVHTLNKGEMDDRKEPSEFHKTQVMKEVEKLKAEQDKKKEEEKKDGDIEVYDEPDVDSKENVNDVIKTKKQIDKDSKEPIYQIKYSNNFELNKFFYNPQGFEETPKIDYKKIIIEINTPLMEGISDAELEIDTKKLKFKYKDIYLLNLDLPIEINRDSTKAKFEKSKKILTLSADIVHKKQQIPEKKIDENMEIINEEEEKRKEEEKKKKEEEERIKKETEEKKKKEEEEKKKKEEELRIKKEKEMKEKQEKERIEKEKKDKERKEKEQLEKNKEETVFIRGKKDNNDNSLLKNNNELKDIKYKEENETDTKQNKKLIEEIIPEEKAEEKKDDNEEIREDEINTTVPMKKQLEIFRKRREEVKKGENDKNKKVTKIKEIKKEKQEIEKKEEKQEKEENKKHDEDDIVLKSNNNQINTQNNSKEDTRTPTCFLSFLNDWICEID